MFLVRMIVVCALVFDFINGFHDTANAIATVVSTRVLSPRAAIFMAGGLNLLGALCFTKVAQAIANDIVSNPTSVVILAAILGAILWNLATWYFGIPSSSSHALIGGLIGGAWMHGGRQHIKWHGVLDKVVLPLVLSPLAGFAIGFLVMALIFLFFANAQAAKTGRVFRGLQIVSSAIMSFAHGSNDAQKSMGIITLALVTFHAQSTKDVPVPLWVKLACAVAMAAGTSMGGWRIIKTMGHKIIRLEPVNGFAAETSASIVILFATLTGKTVSTTHVISGSIFGVGAAKRLSAVRWSVAQTMLTAWVLTIPASAAVAALCYLGFHFVGLK